MEGTWKLYGTVTLYITDITKMTPKVNTLTPYEWLAALPIFEIVFKDRNENTLFTAFQAKIESNRPLITIPVNALLKNLIEYQRYDMYSNVILPSPNDINITEDDIRFYKYNLYLERISGCEEIDDSALE